MNERHHQLLNLLAKYKKLEVTKLSELLKVSQVTIRKDLDHLESQGLIIREHGYATLNDSDDINQRLIQNYDLKQKVAKKAAEMICDGETIMIESGSCCALLALEIAQTKKNVTIITNSAFICDYIRKLNTCTMILLGGDYQAESQVMVGPITRQCAQNFFVDKLFVGTDGFSKETGLTGNDYLRAEAVRDMAKQAKNVYVVTDSSKFHQTGLVKLLDLDAVSAMITDQGIDQDSVQYLSHYLEVIKA